MANYERMEEIKALVKEKEEGIIQEYISLGKLYFNIHKDDEMQMFKDVNDILQLQAEIRDLEEELVLLQKDADTEVPYTPSTESTPVADFYPEDSKIAKSAFLYKEIFGRENPMLSGLQSEEAGLEKQALAEEDAAVVEEALAGEDAAVGEEALAGEEALVGEEATSVSEEAVAAEVVASALEDGEDAVSTQEEAGETVEAVSTQEEAGETVEAVSTQEEAGEAVEAVSTQEEAGEAVEAVSTQEEAGETVAAGSEDQVSTNETGFVANPFLVEVPKQEENAPVMFDSTETFVPAFGSNGNEEVDDSKTEVLESNMFEEERTSVIKDNYAGFGAGESIAPMPEQSNKSVSQNPFSQPFSQPGFKNQFNQPSQFGQSGQFNQPGFQNNVNQPGGFNSPFKKNPEQTQQLNPYDYQPKAEAGQTPSPMAATADSAIDNERTMILDPMPMGNQNSFTKMQPNASSANTIHCMSCGKDAPVANFCIFCGAKMK